jgi:hypothetical protein
MRERTPFPAALLQRLPTLKLLVTTGRRTAALDVRAVDQRYTCLQTSAHGAVYRFESGDFSADLSVDRDGLVIDYPGGWRRADLLDDHD